MFQLGFNIIKVSIILNVGSRTLRFSLRLVIRVLFGDHFSLISTVHCYSSVPVPLQISKVQIRSYNCDSSHSLRGTLCCEAGLSYNKLS